MRIEEMCQRERERDAGCWKVITTSLPKSSSLATTTVPPPPTQKGKKKFFYCPTEFINSTRLRAGFSLPVFKLTQIITSPETLHCTFKLLEQHNCVVRFHYLIIMIIKIFPFVFTVLDGPIFLIRSFTSVQLFFFFDFLKTYTLCYMHITYLYKLLF